VRVWPAAANMDSRTSAMTRSMLPKLLISAEILILAN
jgi:hypothetical protein